MNALKHPEQWLRQDGQHPVVHRADQAGCDLFELLLQFGAGKNGVRKRTGLTGANRRYWQHGADQFARVITDP